MPLRVIREGDVLRLGPGRALALRAHRFHDFESMLRRLGYRRAAPKARGLPDALATRHRLRNYERLAALHRVPREYVLLMV